jgi:chromate transport protein ChrA
VPISSAVPGLMATAVACLAGWIAGSAIQAVAGTFASLLVSGAVATVCFYVSRRFFADLRGGS